MIYDWCFVEGGTNVAMSTGTVHRMETRHVLLYDARSRHQLQEWNSDSGQPLPPWAKDLER
jgi:hypothetical protein